MLHLIRVRKNHLSRREKIGGRERSYTFEWVHLYKGWEGLTGIQLPQRLRGTLFPHPPETRSPFFAQPPFHFFLKNEQVLSRLL